MINIDEIAKVVAERIVARVDANPADYAEELDEDTLIESVINEVTDGVELPDHPEKSEYWFYTEIAEHRDVQFALDGARIIIKDWKSDQKLFGDGSRRDLMKAYGLKESDF